MNPTTTSPAGIEVEQSDSVLVARMWSTPHGEFVPGLADALADLVTRAHEDDSVRAVVLTGTHPGRFLSHASISWLQEGGQASPKVGPRAASTVMRAVATARRSRLASSVARRTPLDGAVQLDRVHHTLTRMNFSGVVFIAALNGSALGFGAELAWACDLRLMVDGDHFIGQPEILLGFTPGGGGTQRLSRLVGQHRSLVAMLEGRPLPAGEAHAMGAIDELVSREQLITRAVELGQRFGTRPKRAVAAVKRAVYLGGSMSLKDGLHLERSEFLSTVANADAQSRMLDYRRQTEESGELPFYDPESYAVALETGRLPVRRTPAGA